MRIDPEELDLDRFRRLTAAGRALMNEAPDRAAQSLRSALGLWRGSAFIDLESGSLPPPEVTALEEERLAVLEDCIDAELDSGLGAELVAELEQLTAAFPLRERLHQQRIIALYRAGRQADALTAYQHARQFLQDELGIDPGPELQRLEEAVLRHDPVLSALVPSRRVRSTLPSAPAQMIGREREFGDLATLIADPGVRLVTVLGTGGTGKTRLTVEVAHGSERAFPDGVFFVALAPVADAALLLPTIATALNIKLMPERTSLELVQDRLDGRQALLVLDNFEQLLLAAPQVGALVASTTLLTVLVTSRAALGLSGEHEYPIAPLPLPPITPAPLLADLCGNEAVQLFTERAQAVVPAFTLDTQAALQVAKICHRVDGLPLAIELAAARIRALGLEEILRRLETPLRLLTVGPRDVPQRQQTLRRTLEWSLDLLTRAQRELFAQLGVFSGGWTLDAAEEVCGSDDTDVDVLDTVEALVGNSLVNRTSRATHDSRFAMLATIREYALELLDQSPEADMVRRRHARFYLALAETAESELLGSEQVAWMARLAREQDNMRASMSWAIEQARDPETGLRLATALGHFWEMAGALEEGWRWLGKALALEEEQSDELRMRAYSAAGTLAWAAGRHDRAASLHEKALARSRQVGDTAMEAFTLNNLGALLVDRHDHARAESLFQEAAELALRAGDARTAGMAWHNLGEVAFHRADYQTADHMYQRALQVFNELDDQWLVTGALRGAAVTALRAGQELQAVKYLKESLRLAAELGENSWVAEGLEGLAAASATMHTPGRAARLLGAAAAIRERIGAPLQAAEQSGHDLLFKRVRDAMSTTDFLASVAGGRKLSMHEAVKEALTPENS